MTGQTVKIPEQKEMSAVYGAEHLLRMIGASIWIQNSCNNCTKLSFCSESASDGSELDDGSGIGAHPAGICPGVDEVRLLSPHLAEILIKLYPLASWSLSENVCSNRSTRRRRPNTKICRGRDSDRLSLTYFVLTTLCIFCCE